MDTKARIYSKEDKKRIGRKTSKNQKQHPLEIGDEPQEKKSKRINETTTENKEADNENKSRKMQYQRHCITDENNVRCPTPTERQFKKSEKEQFQLTKTPKPTNQYNPKAACTRRSSRRKSSSPNYLREKAETVPVVVRKSADYKMAANKKKQDEKHLKMLRDMVALPNNKECFDCHQRGPTYVNMTTGSYVCTACSGLLRGLNPPHRVKSISMASFTPEEMEFLKCHGNEFCRKVWLGLYDAKAGLEPDSREEQKVKEFMLQKYEKKRYYVAPTEAMKEEARQINEGALNKQPATKPLKALLGENAPRLVVDNQKKNLPPVKAPVTPQNSQSSQVTTPQSPGNVSQSSKSSGSATMDLLGDLGGDPFASSASAQSRPAGGGGFADFGSFGTQFSKQSAAPVSAAPGFTSSNPLQPMAPGSTTSVSANGPFSSASSTFPSSHSGDKYAALSSLEDVFSSTSSTSHSTTGSLDWKGTGSSTTPGTAINWGGSSGTTGGSTINWNSQGKTASEGMTSVNWSGSSSSGGTVGGGNSGINWNSSSASANPTTAANPFGGAGPTQTSMTGMGVANPFGSTGSQNLFSTAHSAPQQPSGYGHFGTPGTAGGFGQFGTAGTVPNTAGGGFGQFGSSGVGMVPSTVSGFGQYNTPVSASAGFGGQFGIQNGGFGTGGSASQGFHGFGGQQVPPYGGGGWGQMPASSSANPFMTAATQQQPGRGSSTNPFL
ncbi:hypothetical protein CHS0354_013655 [Potamilus streckersoni]|uniref:Arf-GAP domain-containing protein n=1 Tax=Potamilus streckersoni TaxID=2493646 RepID=A0AAE0RQX8_9BIVA|nr:hypothetical protein CHS0354_013655 [Potamilus streckersoni]